jgi:hypothetical protein
VYNLKEWQKTQDNDIMATITSSLNLPISLNHSFQHHYQNNKDKIGISLGDVLNSSNTGTMIEQYYKSNSKFNDGKRTLLVDTVINYVITKKIPMSHICVWQNS